MALNTYKDFLQLGMNCLQDYLSVRGLNTTRRKTELVARAIAAFEMKLPIIASSEEQQKKLSWTMKIGYRNLKFVTHYQLNHPKE